MQAMPKSYCRHFGGIGLSRKQAAQERRFRFRCWCARHDSRHICPCPWQHKACFDMVSGGASEEDGRVDLRQNQDDWGPLKEGGLVLLGPALRVLSWNNVLTLTKQCRNRKMERRGEKSKGEGRRSTGCSIHGENRNQWNHGRKDILQTIPAFKVLGVLWTSGSSRRGFPVLLVLRAFQAGDCHAGRKVLGAVDPLGSMSWSDSQR